MLAGFEHDSINKEIDHNGKFFCVQWVKETRMLPKIRALDFDFYAEKKQVNVFFELNIF